MLKISVAESLPSKTTLRVEGQVKGPWVGEVRDSCEKLLAQGSELTLELSQVTFVDVAGIALLFELRDRDVRIAAAPLFVSHVLGSPR